MAHTGMAFLLKLGDGADPLTYETVAGLRATRMTINGALSEDGASSVSVSASGNFLGSNAESAVRAHALAGTLDDYELSFDDGERLRGRFLVQRLDYSGDFNGERTYTLHLESSGAVRPA